MSYPNDEVSDRISQCFRCLINKGALRHRRAGMSSKFSP